ncbi:hypothetical protein PG994_002395 [Apiospora phragmitis]|uniref:Uncharacterized protein n=1 Tax=Apiospora phragmitis TaxID=2905665 RepID=A0ABR1WWB0_9PEZI
MCERAFLRNYICHGMNGAYGNRARFHPDWRLGYDGPGNANAEFWSRHMAARIPNSVAQKIRRVVNLHAGLEPRADGTEGHTCGYSSFRVKAWKPTIFKGAQELYTAKMVTIPSGTELRPVGLVEWKKSADPRVLTCAGGNIKAPGNGDEAVEE